MVTSYHGLDEQIRETAHRTAAEQGLPPVIDDPVALAPAVAAVGDYFDKNKSGTKEKTDAA